jgi:hypothetical protein
MLDLVASSFSNYFSGAFYYGIHAINPLLVRFFYEKGY